jgi:hypothetical protein
VIVVIVVGDCYAGLTITHPITIELAEDYGDSEL